MIGFNRPNFRELFDYVRRGTKDTDSRVQRSPVEYMFKDAPPPLEEGVDPVESTVELMDACGVEMGLLGGDPDDELTRRALRDHPNRFFFGMEIDPNDVTGTVREIRRLKAELDIKAVSSFPAGLFPQVAVNDPKMYPIYQTCIDLQIPVIVNGGIAGPRFPSECQDVMLFDRVCYDFPELTIVIRHGAEPQEDVAVKLMLKWPGLHYMTSAFAPKHYPKAIVDFANTRGADKIMYAGFHPMGLSLTRIFEEMPKVPFRDHVWPKFLRENALRVFNLAPVNEPEVRP